MKLCQRFGKRLRFEHHLCPVQIRNKGGMRGRVHEMAAIAWAQLQRDSWNGLPLLKNEGLEVGELRVLVEP